MDLQLEELRAFVAVAEELHFGRAAMRLAISQPQVSRRVRSLEDRLGVAVFVRTPRRTTLTDAGAMLLDDARDTLAAADRLQVRAESARRGRGGRVVVGFVWSTLGRHVAPLVAAAAERHPEVSLSICQLRFVEIVPSLRRGDVDLAIVRRLHEEHEMIELTLRREPTVMAMPAEHELAREDKVSLEQLSGLPQVALRRDLAPGAYDGVLAAAREAGLEIRIVRSAVSPAEALALVSTGVGLYRLPSSAAQPHPGVVYRELEGARSRLVLVRRPEPPSPAIAAICQLAGELFSDTPDASNDGLTGLDLSPAAA